jgi:ribonuclease-3
LSDRNIHLSAEIVAARAQLQDRIDYHFNDETLLAEALTHSSILKQDGEMKHNQRLEFLGDRVIGLLIADALFSSTDKEREGVLTDRYARHVSNARLGSIARDLKIGPALLVQPNTKLSDTDNVLADALEALIGAVWRDGGIEETRRVVLKIWEPLLDESDTDTRNFKTHLQEHAHKHKIDPPEYEIIDREGPQHAPEFTVTVNCGAHLATAKGVSKRQAEQAAAEAWLSQFAGSQNAG